MDELVTYLTPVIEREHDYGTSAAAASVAALAAFNFVCKKLGLTGFQAGFAALDFYGRAMSIDGGFIVLKLQDMLYPQYDLPQKLHEYMTEESTIQWLADEARKKLANVDPFTHPDVLKHWEHLAAQRPPTNPTGDSKS
jgi:hypothetical protein